MRPAFYELCERMAAWMKYGAESVFDVEGGAYPQRSDVPVTVRGGTWYLHFLSREKRTATLTGVTRPASARVLRTGQAAALRQDGDQTVVTLPDAPPTDLDEVVALG